MPFCSNHLLLEFISTHFQIALFVIDPFSRSLTIMKIKYTSVMVYHLFLSVLDIFVALVVLGVDYLCCMNFMYVFIVLVKFG